MDKEKEPETTWERVSDLSLPNQVKLLCDCIDEIKELAIDVADSVSEINEAEKTKPPKK